MFDLSSFANDVVSSAVNNTDINTNLPGTDFNVDFGTPDIQTQPVAQTPTTTTTIKNTAQQPTVSAPPLPGYMATMQSPNTSLPLNVPGGMTVKNIWSRYKLPILIGGGALAAYFLFMRK